MDEPRAVVLFVDDVVDVLAAYRRVLRTEP